VNGELDYTVSVDDVDLKRLIDDLKKTQAELQRVSRDAGQVAASMAKYEAIDFSKTIAKAQASGGNSAVKGVVNDAAAMTTGVNKINTALWSMNSILSGNLRALASMAGTGGVIVGAFTAAYQVGKKLADLAFGLLDKMAGAPSVNNFVKFYQDCANAAQSAMKQNEITMDKFVSDASAAADGINKAIARIQKGNARRSGVEESAQKYQLARGAISPEEDINATMNRRTRDAQAMKDSAQGEFSKISGHAGKLQKQFNKADLDYENIRAQAGGAESPELTAALELAKDSRDKIKKQYEETLKQLAAVRESLNDTVAEANAEIERAQNEAGAAFQARKNEREKQDSESRISSANSENEARKKRLVAESQYRYHAKYDGLSDQDKLRVTERNVSTWKGRVAGASTEKDRYDATEGLKAQLQIRDELKKRIAESSLTAAGKQKEDAASRAERIKDAQGNISKARERQVGGSDLAGYFQRTSDLKHGRTPQDNAAKQTADNTRIIAENTSALKELGVVRP
jgi:hypothetical protein